jgi:hypothetical protein
MRHQTAGFSQPLDGRGGRNGVSQSHIFLPPGPAGSPPIAPPPQVSSCYCHFVPYPIDATSPAFEQKISRKPDSGFEPEPAEGTERQKFSPLTLFAPVKLSRVSGEPTDISLFIVGSPNSKQLRLVRGFAGIRNSSRFCALPALHSLGDGGCAFLRPFTVRSALFVFFAVNSFLSVKSASSAVNSSLLPQLPPVRFSRLSRLSRAIRVRSSGLASY